MTNGLALLVGRFLAGGAAAGCLTLGVWLAVSQSGWLDPEIAPPAISASLLIEEFSCRRGETRTVLRRGVEDGYAGGNFEPSRPDRAGSQRIPGVGLRDYDDAAPDREFHDYFEPPRDAVSGLFVIRMTEAADSHNDSFVIGDDLASRGVTAQAEQTVFQTSVQQLGMDPVWSVTEDVYSVDIANVILGPGPSLLDFIRDPAFPGFVDVVISDDTAVDFMGLALCSPPVSDTGLTFWYSSILPDPVSAGPARATCYPSDDSESYCDPFVGNTSCATELPLLCFRPGDRPAPDLRGLGVWESYMRFWTGGTFALSEPVAAEGFSTLDDANAACRDAFGDGWRVADFHLSGRGFEIVAEGPAEYDGRVWIDIRDQPYAACWGRE